LPKRLVGEPLLHDTAVIKSWNAERERERKKLLDVDRWIDRWLGAWTVRRGSRVA
jgi:hypothetical protein